jgi:ATP-dependent exoDNAse (exonuclease V) beta subunit
MAGSMRFSSDDPSKVLAANSPSHRADAGQAWGALIHGLLEHAMSQKNATAEDLQRLGMWLTVEQPQSSQVLELAVKTVLFVSKSDFWDKAKRSDCSVETPFAFAESPNAMLTGVIDLLFGQFGRWQIIDYKTDVDPPNGTECARTAGTVVSLRRGSHLRAFYRGRNQPGFSPG